MSAPAAIHRGHDVRQVPSHPELFLESCGCLHGPPRLLSRVCEGFGFKNRCERGSVYLTAAKVARLSQILEGLR